MFGRMILSSRSSVFFRIAKREFAATLVLACALQAQNVVVSPTASQNIVQPAGTSLNDNTFNNIQYVTAAYNWSQSPTGSLSVGSNTIALTPCPAGINTLNNSAQP
jgi:hypothetical protein